MVCMRLVKWPLWGFTGPHRLASNSLLDGLVFGHRAARTAVVAAVVPRIVSVLPPVSPVTSADMAQCLAAKAEIRDLMWRYAGIIRSKEGLTHALASLAQFQWVTTLPMTTGLATELKSMWIVSDLVLRFSLERTESRGGHYREDFPTRNDTHWQRHLSRERGVAHVDTEQTKRP